MPADLRDLRDPETAIPEFLVIDTSLVLELQAPPEKWHPDHPSIVAFMSRLRAAALAGRCLAILPYVAFEEALFVTLRQAIECEASRRGLRSWQALYKSDPSCIGRAMPVVLGVIRAWRALGLWTPDFEGAPATLFRRPMHERVPELAVSMAILSRDAAILAAAESLEVTHVASIDADWKRASGFVLLGIP